MVASIYVAVCLGIKKFYHQILPFYHQEIRDSLKYLLYPTENLTYETFLTKGEISRLGNFFVDISKPDAYILRV
jgi:hypothetical protein